MMNKWISISISVVLVAGLAASLFLYFQESSNLKAAESEIVTLEGNVSTLEGDLVMAEAGVLTLEGDLAAAEATVSTLEADLAVAEARVSTLEADLAALEAELALVPVTFPDANLEAAIRDYLNKTEGPINKFHLEGLTMLVAQGRDIRDLTGLEYCVNLRRLDLKHNNISDISVLAGLTNLEVLNLGNNNISDISVLAGLTNLEELYLWSNSISDISPLVANSGLSQGDILWLQDNPLSTTSVNVYIPQLQQRGIVITY